MAGRGEEYKICFAKIFGEIPRQPKASDFASYWEEKSIIPAEVYQARKEEEIRHRREKGVYHLDFVSLSGTDRVSKEKHYCDFWDDEDDPSDWVCNEEREFRRTHMVDHSYAYDPPVENPGSIEQRSLIADQWWDIYDDYDEEDDLSDDVIIEEVTRYWDLYT